MILRIDDNRIALYILSESHLQLISLELAVEAFVMFLVSLATFFLIFTQNRSQSSVQFVCKSGHLLNGIDKICDGHLDCYDGSDEAAELCTHIFCPINYFKCHNGACVHRSKKCNGIRDCVDGTDETNCGRKWNSCEPTEFNCGNNADESDSYRYCIDGSKICDKTLDCADGGDENKTICENPLCPEKSFRCNYGGCISDSVLCDGFFDCIDGSDEAQDLCINLKCPKCTNFVSCPSLVAKNINSDRISMECEWNGRRMSCAQNILPGTRVSYACKDHFHPKSLKHLSNDWNLCQADGTWLRDVLECEPDCGRMSADIKNHWTLLKSLPWHATVFVIENHEKPKFICGATLISETVAITAAHCVWKSKAEDLQIGLGNFKTEFEDPDDFSARYYTVREIIAHPNYLDQFGDYGSDIALIEMSKSVELDETIMPACFEENIDDITAHLAEENNGIIVSLGMAGNASVKDFLHVAEMPVISNQKCMDQQPKAFRKFLTFATFCAGWANGLNACNGDSGAGLSFQKTNDRYYLQGIVSIGRRQLSTTHCDPNQYAIFTKAAIYSDWIKSHLNRINSRFNAQLCDGTTSDVDDDDNSAAVQW